MTNEYQIENDITLMQSIDHFAKLANNENSKYKFIEIMKRIESDDIVFIDDLKLLETEFNCPIRKQLVKASGYYLGIEISKISELNKYCGNGKGRSKAFKLTYNALVKAINALY